MARVLVREQAWLISKSSADLSRKTIPRQLPKSWASFATHSNCLLVCRSWARKVRKIKTTEELRMWLSPAFRNYLIFYRELPEGVEIVRVLHSARDIQRILEGS